MKLCFHEKIIFQCVPDSPNQLSNSVTFPSFIDLVNNRAAFVIFLEGGSKF